MKVNKKIIGLIICSLLVFSTCGCQQKIEDVREPDKIEQVELDVEALENEYNAMIDLAVELTNILNRAEGELGLQEAIDAFSYIQNNRIKPTQRLTIELDKAFDELLDVGLKYAIASEAEKPELEARMIEILEVMEAISYEIEKTINSVDEL